MYRECWRLGAVLRKHDDILYIYRSSLESVNPSSFEVTQPWIQSMRSQAGGVAEGGAVPLVFVRFEVSQEEGTS